MNLQSTLTRRELRLFRLIDRLLRLIGRIPRPAARLFGNALGEAVFWLGKRHRSITLKNLRFALEQELDSAQRQSLAKAVYRNLGQILFEVGWSLNADWETLCRHIAIEGIENYKAAYEKGKGVLRDYRPCRQLGIATDRGQKGVDSHQHRLPPPGLQAAGPIL